MEEFLLSFDMVAVVVVDSDIRVRGAFEKMCKFLKITLWPLSHGNNKGNSVENHHQLLKKKQAISGQNHVIHDVFILNAKTTQYARNSAPIDDTDMIHSVTYFGRELIFNLDKELLPTPTLNPNNNQVLLKYLRDINTNSQFTISGL